ncbi:MAG: hypothetical protein M5U28_29745 [Sandaracinaceae bacterium]|nr:hypothetical protein [Sandaracinaceae bacterium]
MRRLALSAFALSALALGACTPVVPEGRFACLTDDDCPDEMVCRTERGRCYATRADAGPRDGDAGAPRDAGADASDGPADAGSGGTADAAGGADGGSS